MSCLIACLVQFAYAQSTTNDTIKEWERAKAYTKEYLDAMPERGYPLKPTPEMRSFAEQMLHITDTNYSFGSAVFGQKSPYGMGELEKSTTDNQRKTYPKLCWTDMILSSTGSIK